MTSDVALAEGGHVAPSKVRTVHVHVSPGTVSVKLNSSTMSTFGPWTMVFVAPLFVHVYSCCPVRPGPTKPTAITPPWSSSVAGVAGKSEGVRAVGGLCTT